MLRRSNLIDNYDHRSTIRLLLLLEQKTQVSTESITQKVAFVVSIIVRKTRTVTVKK